MQKQYFLRHGDLLLYAVTSLPTGLTKAKTSVIMTGSGGNDHIAVNCDIYFKGVDQFIFGYLKAKKGAVLRHLEHGKNKVNGMMEAKLKVGVYEMRKQHSETHEGMKPIID